MVAAVNLRTGDFKGVGHDQIFWIDTPVDMCVERLSARVSDAVERKGSAYLGRVREVFERYAGDHGTTRTLDGRSEISALVEQVLAIVEGRSHNDRVS